MTMITPTRTPRHPLPGSPEAKQLGCDCNVGENKNGIGDNGIWYVVNCCPVHGKFVDEVSDFDALRSVLRQRTNERDRYFNMKRVNAGLYGFERAKVQKARAKLREAPELFGNSTVWAALDILGEPPPTDLHLHDLLDAYRRCFEKEREAAEPSTDDENLGHLITMCTLTQDWFDRGEIDKANRWLGFIQCALWMINSFTIDQLREHMQGKLP